MDRLEDMIEIKEASNKRPHSVQLHFYEVSRIGKSMERMKVDLRLPRVWVWVGWA